MRNRLLYMSSCIVLACVLSSCASKPAANNATASGTPKPANASGSPAAATRTPPPAPQTKIENKDKPAGQNTKAVPENKRIAVPENWIYYADPVKGYGFWLPAGSVGDNATADGVDVFVARTPAPSEVSVEVYAWKDRTQTKEDLLKMTIDEMAETGEVVTAGDLVAESEDYALAEATSVDSAGKKYKMKILVATDVTDNYVMVIYTDEGKFEANRAIVDTIWGNFEMYSGGASGTS